MTTERQLKIDLTNSTAGAIPYVKADVFQLSAIGGDVTMSCHQINYQQIADLLAKGGPGASLEGVGTIVVSKVVMNRESFARLLQAVTELDAQLASQNAG